MVEIIDWICPICNESFKVDIRDIEFLDTNEVLICDVCKKRSIK
ncbi:MAG: hypothetical protein WC307_06840 [Candidatus Nanoarchaeia archaeon]|jgi:hypothetical protein